MIEDEHTSERGRHLVFSEPCRGPLCKKLSRHYAQWWYGWTRGPWPLPGERAASVERNEPELKKAEAEINANANGCKRRHWRGKVAQTLITEPLVTDSCKVRYHLNTHNASPRLIFNCHCQCFLNTPRFSDRTSLFVVLLYPWPYIGRMGKVSALPRLILRHGSWPMTNAMVG
jgi:hypothetical protein